MPTLLQWEYEAKNDSSIKERRGIQRSFFGDTVVDDYLGQGTGASPSIYRLMAIVHFLWWGFFWGTKVDQLNMDMLARQLE